MSRDQFDRFSRRRFAKGAVGFGIAAPALGGIIAGGGSVFAQDATPSVESGPIGEQLDLANLSPEVPEPTEPVTITFASWIGDSENLKMLYEQFHTIHPNITVEFQGIPAEEMNQKLTTQIAGGNPPDAAYLDQSAVVDFASRSALLDLEPYIAKSIAIDKDDYVEAFKSAAVWEDKLFGLPIDGESTGLFYRTDLFEAAGIAAPPTTWEEFGAAAQALTNADTNTYGTIIFAPEAAYYWYPWLWQNGGDLLSEDGTQIAFNSPEGKEAAEFYIGLAKYSPPDYYNSNSYDGRVAFATGNVAMYVAGAWFSSVLQDEFPDINGKWNAAPLPQRKVCATTVAGDTLVIPAGSKNQDAAWKWIEFLSAPQNLIIMTLGTAEHPGSLLPTRTSLLNDPRIFENNPILKGFADQMACGVTNAAPNPNWGPAEVALNDALGRAIYGEVSASDALDEAADEAQVALEG